MKRKGCWRSYERHVLDLDPILVRMSERGLPVNDQKRIEFGQKIDAMAEELNGRIQALVPEEVKPLHSPGGTGYRKDPQGRRGRRQHHPRRAAGDLGEAGVRGRRPEPGQSRALGEGAAVQFEQLGADRGLHPVPRPPDAEGTPDGPGHDLEARVERNWPSAPATSFTNGWSRSAS